jgi:plastocyanin
MGGAGGPQARGCAAETSGIHPPYGCRRGAMQKKEPAMQARFNILLTAALALAVAAPTYAAEHVVTQKNKTFSTKKLKVKVGDSIKFVNEDSFAHNVFSLSAPKSFDTGSFGNSQTRSVNFDKPGTVEIECAVHPDMRLDVEVAP